MGDKSPVTNTLSKGVNILNQIAYRVMDLDAAEATMRAAGAFPTGRPQPAIAFGGARVQFFLVPTGYVLELIEAPDFQHVFKTEQT